MNSLVSVIIPTFNRAEKIIKTLDSIVSQTYPNIEIIVVDDGSTDDTEQKIHSYIDENTVHHRLFYYRQKNQGAPSARNKGLSLSNGNLVVFFDSDDLMLPERILKQVNAIENNNSDACSCGFQNSEDGKVFIPMVDESIGFIGSLILWKLMGSTQSWLYRKDLLLRIGGYDKSYNCYQDWDLTFRYLTQCQKISVVPESLSIFNNDNRTDRITSQVDTLRRISNIQKYYSKIILWLLSDKTRYQLFDEVIFSYVHIVTIAYYKNSKPMEAKKSYDFFKKLLKSASYSTSFWCKTIFFKHLFKTSAKNLMSNFKLQLN